MGATSIRKSLARGAHQAAKQAKKIVLSMLAVLLVASGISVSPVSGSSVAYAATTVAGVTFDTIASADDYDYSLKSESRGWIYFDETITMADAELSYSSSFRQWTREEEPDVINIGPQIQTNNNYSTRTYGSSANPALTLTVKDAGFTSDGESIDVVFKINTARITPLTSVYNAMYSIFRYTDDTTIFADGFVLKAALAASGGVYLDCEISVYYSGAEEDYVADNLVSGYDFVWEVGGLSMTGTLNSADDPPEAIYLSSSTATNTVYLATNTRLTTRSVTLSLFNQTYAAIYPSSTVSGATFFQAGFMTTISTGTISFIWSGDSAAGTTIALASAQSAYTTTLAIENEASGNYGDTTKDFSYELELTYGSGKALSDTFDITYYDSSGNEDYTGTVTFTDSKITALTGSDGTTLTNDDDSNVTTISLKLGESFAISGLPAGVKYTLSQTTEDANYSTSVHATATVGGTWFTADSNLSGHGETGSLGMVSTITFTNARQTGNLEISKTVSATYADTSDETFTFTVTLSDTLASGESNVITDAFTVSGSGGNTEGIPASVTFRANDDGTTSSATISLKNGQTATITDLPSGATYTVTETANGNYTTSWTVNETSTTDPASGTISTTASRVAFTNTIQTFTLTIYKYTTGANGDEGLPGAKFSVEAVDSSGNTLTNGTIDLGTNNTTDSDGELNISGLEATVVYKITEDSAPSGYTLRNDVYIMVAYDSTEEKLVGYYWEFGENDTISFDTSNALVTDLSTDGNNNFQVKILNTQIESLPQTGGSGTLLFSVAGVALIALAAYALYCQRRGIYACASHAASPYQAFKSSSYASHASTSQARTSSPYASYVPLSQVLKSKPYASHAMSSQQARASKHRPTRRARE